MNSWPLPIAIALALASLLSGQELSHTTAPMVIAKIDPVYLDQARLLHLEGDVILRVIVGTDGLARNPQVVGRYIGAYLDQSAIDAVQKWRFAPATKDGQPVEMPAQVEVNFRIRDKTSWRAQHYDWREANLCLESDGLEIQSVVDPRAAEDAPSATATVTFGVSEKGEPYSIKVAKSSDDGWASDVTKALVQWRFTPVDCDGRPFGTLFTVLFVRGPYDPGAKP
jgi:TonB family protein